MQTLDELANLYCTDKKSSNHNYTKFYAKYFESLRDKKLNVCEIGILNHPDKVNWPYEGASLLMWRDYFYNSRIHGIDINDHSSLNQERIETYIADQADRTQLDNIFKDKQVDIIIEDGGHWMHQQQISLGFLFKNLKPGGYFVIEDLRTSFPDEPYNNMPAILPGQKFKNKSSDTLTLQMLVDFNKTGKIDSCFMTSEEIDYLNSCIDKCIIEEGEFSEIAFITKKV